MPQTLLAILAMMIASLFAMQMHRNVAHQQMRMIRNEVAMQGTGVAEDLLGVIGSKPYDGKLVGEGEEADGPGDLTAGPPFGTDNISEDDIDDWDDYSATRTRTVGGNTLRFRVEAAVVYVDPSDLETEVSGPTKAKKVTVRTSNLDLPNLQSAEVSRSFTCGSKCTW